MENGSPFYFLIQLVCDCLSNSLYCSQIPQQNVQFQLDLKPTGTLGLLYRHLTLKGHNLT